MEDAREQKRALRAEIRDRRRALSAEARAHATAAVTARLVALTATLAPRTIACYLSSPSEPDTGPFLEWAGTAGIRVLVPLSRPNGVLDWAEADGSGVVGELGVPVPTGAPLGPRALEEAELVLIPAAAVDRSGFRMGWGLGYYDRTLANIPLTAPVWAIVFDDEVLDEVPREPHDRPVDGVLTPSTTRRFAHGTYP